MVGTPENQHSSFFYLKHVRIGEAFAELNGFFWAWVVFSIGSILIGWLFDKGAESLQIFHNGTETLQDFELTSWLPKGSSFFIAFGVFTWVMRGKQISIDVPKVGFGGWLTLNVCVVGFAFLFTRFPWWFSLPVYYAIFIFIGCFESLVVLGKRNYERIGALSDEQ